MKSGGSLQRLRVKQVSVALIALVCTTFIVWGRERAPFLRLILPDYLQENRLETLFSGSTSDRPPVMKRPPSERELLRISGLPSNATKDFPVENSPSSSVCDYTEGKWVEDSRRPIYSGKMCKQWLSGMWACRLTQRPDFYYEKYRWQPNNCDLPNFEGQHFLKKMQNKTLAFVGDSLGRQQFQSIMCIITGGKDSPDVQNVGKEYGLARARGAIRPAGWAFRFPKTNTTVLYYWSASLCEIEPLNPENPSTEFAMHLDRPAWFLRTNIYRFDVVVLNTGHHWNKGKLKANRWQMYVNGQPNKDRKLRDFKSARNLTVHSVAKWFDKQLDKYPNLRVFMRTLSPRHFSNGDWNSGGRCDNTKLLSEIHNVSRKRANDPAAESAVQGTRVQSLDITGFSELRDDAHISKYHLKLNNSFQDCLHWCLPGVPDTWNELLFAQLLFPQPKNLSAEI